MQLYSGLSTEFIRDSVHNRIAEKLKDAFFRQFRYHPPQSELNSWRNSLRAVSQVLDDAKLHDHGILIEYQLPMSSRRLDCMVTGQDADRRDSAVIIELKQWDRCADAGADNLVSTRVGGAERDLLHPSAQVGGYQSYLEDSHTAFYEPPSPIRLASCAYLHNYVAEDDDVLFAERFRPILDRSPVFTADDVLPLETYLLDRAREGHGEHAPSDNRLLSMLMVWVASHPRMP